MLTFRLLLLYLFAFYTKAAVFSSSVQINAEALVELLGRNGLGESRPFDEVLKSHELRKRAQSPINFEDDLSASGNHRVEIWDGPLLTPYLVPAALGNPPQPFRLLIDLAWDTLFVPSADCTGDCNDFDMKLRFYSNESSTYSLLDPDAGLTYGTDRFMGELGTDTFRIAGLEIEDQYFVNVDRASPLGFISFYFGYDGVLGLAPRWNHPLTSDWPTQAPSPWSMMVNQSVLDANLFALELPNGIMDWQDLNRLGEIIFGGINDKYTSSNFSRLPLSDYSDQVWAVEAQSITWENETHPIHEDFSNLTLAGFDTTAWFIGLPGHWPEKIYASVEHDCGFLNCVIDCNARKRMPNITFGLADQKFTLTPFDYTVEMMGPAKMRVCFFDIYPSRDQFPVDAIVLGKPFMEAFYSVFDLDEKEVRLTRRIEGGQRGTDDPV